MKGFAIAMQYVIFWILVLGLGNNAATAGWYQKPCTNVRIDLQNVLEQARLTEQNSPRFDEAEIQKIQALLQAATVNPQCLFGAMPDGEAFSLVKALCLLEAYFGDGDNSKRVFLWESFLNQYPHSSHLDKARWLRAKAAATPYEYEGYADAALKQIESIEMFIKENPANNHLLEAELELARVCRIAYETFRYGNGLSTTSNKNRQEAGWKYRDQAEQLLEHLCDQSSDPERSLACQALNDLAEGRCVYMGPGSPNPHFPDNWAESK